MCKKTQKNRGSQTKKQRFSTKNRGFKPKIGNFKPENELFKLKKTQKLKQQMAHLHFLCSIDLKTVKSY
jgi:hypothetical protein